MADTEQARPSLGYAWYVVFVLFVAQVLAFIDRQILNLLVAPIRTDLDISDTEMSLLMGIAFAVFFTFCGIPLGRLADSKNRRALIGGGILCWSLMTGACGLARHYWQFLLFRMGVGVGEATLGPAAISLIADYFPKERRATAVSVFTTGAFVGVGLALLLGGLVIRFASSSRGELMLPLVGATPPWQLIFYLLGITGALYSMVLYTVREPERQGVAPGAGAVPIRAVLRYMRKNRMTMLCHHFGFASVALTAYGAAAWVPSWLMRVHGWDPGKVGIIYGGIIIVFGPLGAIAGGHWAGLLARRGHADSNMRVGALAATACILPSAAFPLIADTHLAVALLSTQVFFVSMPFGVALAAIQEMVPNVMRGQAAAVYVFVVNLIGQGLGPTIMALITDYVFRDDAAVGYSIALVGGTSLFGGMLLLWTGLSSYRRSLERASAWVSVRG